MTAKGRQTDRHIDKQMIKNEKFRGKEEKRKNAVEGGGEKASKE